MLDIIVLISLFLLLVGLLALFQYMQGVSGSSDQALGKKLLQAWLEAHSLTLPNVDSILPLLNQQLKDVESEDLERVELTKLLPQTHLPVFNLTRAMLSSDNTEIILHCSAEWPMCLPGVCVEVREKGKLDNITCHFSIDWMTAQMKITLKENQGALLLSYENTKPIQMGVACMVIDGTTSDPDSLAGCVADILQLMLMNLSLSQVSVPPKCNHTPSISSVPSVLVSSADEMSFQSHDQTGNHQSCDQDVATPNEGHSEGVTVEEEVSEIHRQDSEQTVDLESSPLANSPIASVTEEVESFPVPFSREAEDKQKEDIVLSPPSSDVPSSDKMVNGNLPPLIISHESDSSKGASAQTETTPNRTTSPSSWKRTPSYEQLNEIGPVVSKDSQKVPKPFKVRSSSSDHLSSPSSFSPSGKRSLTLSISGSEAESIYGADDRIPSTMVFEVEENGKVRHFVAVTSSHASKLRRRYGSAKKLHIYNDHSFLASRIKNKTDCAACKDKISKLFGKQGYVCRDCDMVVHKECHCKVEEHCLSSTVSSMDLIYPDNATTPK